MRTAVFLSALILTEAMPSSGDRSSDKGQDAGGFSAGFLMFLLLVFVVVDIADFFHLFH